MRLALLLIASLALLGTVAGRRYWGGDDYGCGSGGCGGALVPRSEIRRYRKLAEALVLRDSGEYKVRHLRRIVRAKWLSKWKLDMRFEMYQSTCEKRPQSPSEIAKCWHNHRKPIIICNSKVMVNRFLELGKVLKMNCW
ncbi:hypothetical protein HPB52_020056 [Rhipicephalus sanguineus]|uniref:Uncharacterized protein n=1 Tax=Rhipicephalus sanguineus TaxID=34632 RepID=A0A9D4T4T9_RHISA|nr:hypothetical protein HPB52_020056 [Rhipicephalus sanguineus]